jgi:hypothetical protein
MVYFGLLPAFQRGIGSASHVEPPTHIADM